MGDARIDVGCRVVRINDTYKIVQCETSPKVLFRDLQVEEQHDHVDSRPYAVELLGRDLSAATMAELSRLGASYTGRYCWYH